MLIPEEGITEYRETIQNMYGIELTHEQAYKEFHSLMSVVARMYLPKSIVLKVLDKNEDF
jgi:endonuclease III-like uncharacterized protein